MKKYLWTVSAIILLALASCQEKVEFSDEQKAAIEKEVKAQFEGFTSSVNRLDTKAWSENLSKDEFISVNSGVIYFSTSSTFLDSVQRWFSLRKSQTAIPLETKVTALAPDLALLTSKGNFEILWNTGEQTNDIFLLTFIWKKEESSWKVIHFHESFAPAE